MERYNPQSPALESMLSMPINAGDHEDRPHDAMPGIDRIANKDRPSHQNGRSIAIHIHDELIALQTRIGHPTKMVILN
jgi:hypothetical protein